MGAPADAGRAWKPRAWLGIAVALGLCALSGCGWFSSGANQRGGTAAPSGRASACPSATILRPLANTAMFAPGPSHGPDKVAFWGILSDVDSKCEIAGDTLHVRLDVVLVGERGPAASGDAVDLNYFVAVTGPDQSILSKSPFAVRIAFSGNNKRAGVTDHIEEAVPLAGHSVADLNIVVGFQQSPEAIDFYKHFRGR